MDEPVLDPGNPEQLNALRKLAESAARVGGEIARASFGRRLDVSLKADRSEVTEIDIAAEHAIVDHIRAARPDDLFIGEEGAGSETPQTPGGGSGTPRTPDVDSRARNAESQISDFKSQVSNLKSQISDSESAIEDAQRVYWIIDPIDGTRNYIRGAPFFACSIAAMFAGRPIVGAIFAPMFDTMYSAASGDGFSVNGHKTSLTENARPNPYGPNARLLVGIPSARRSSTRRFALHAIEKHVVRNYGSAALHLAFVAAGQLDATVCGNGKLWDIAAGALLAAESGAVVTSPQGAPIFPLDLTTYAGEDIPMVAGSPAAHKRLFRECGVDNAANHRRM